jgi:rfaE bifunctional protein kinase chain/domain/rfaE bifunctional protein nucleotidyltransferase chain/domain
MHNFSKIYNLTDLLKLISNHKKKKIVLCHGVFDLLHIGHIKYLNKAKTFGDFLIVSVTADEFVNKGPKRPIFNENYRAEALANLHCIDAVFISKEFSAVNIIKKIKPGVYCKGSDYKNLKNDITGKIILEKKAVEKFKGRLVFINEITFSSSKIINTLDGTFNKEQKEFIFNLKKNKNIYFLKKYLDKIKTLKVAVIGETIIDQYIFLETLGKSGKDPYLASKRLFQNDYLGGAAAIVKNMSSFCSNISFITYLGENKNYQNFVKKSLPYNIKKKFFYKKNSPTVLKRRFIDNLSNQKLFGVYDMNVSNLDKNNEKKFLKFISKLEKYDLIVISDYGHGLITNKVSQKLNNIKTSKVLNTQVNASNIGYHSLKKYNNTDLLLINENELRHELRDKLTDIEILSLKFIKNNNFKNIIVTSGNRGSLIISKKNNKIIKCPAFAGQVVDKVGAGDMMLSITSLLFKVGMPHDILIFLGNLAGAISVGAISNSKSLDKTNLIKTFDTFLK